MADDEGPLQRARAELRRAADNTTSDVERQVDDIDERLGTIQSGDGDDEATEDARLEAIAENLAVLREKTDGQTYTKIKHAEEFIQEYRDAQ